MTGGRISEARIHSVPPTGRGLTLPAVLTSIVLVGMNLRPGIVSIGPMVGSIRDEFGLSHAAVALLTAIPDVSMSLLAIAAPGLARRYGRDHVILAALLLLLLATFGRSYVHSVAALFLATAGVGSGIAITGAQMGGPAGMAVTASFLPVKAYLRVRPRPLQIGPRHASSVPPFDLAAPRRRRAGNRSDEASSTGFSARCMRPRIP